MTRTGYQPQLPPPNLEEHDKLVQAAFDAFDAARKAYWEWKQTQLPKVETLEQVKCPACEGTPVWPNDPCTLCMKQAPKGITNVANST